MKCKHCENEFSLSIGQFANHVRWCDKNPKIAEYKEKNSIRGKALGSKRFGEYKKFDVICKNCDKVFPVTERESLFPSKKDYFCSRICANATGGKAKAAKYYSDETAPYFTIAWKNHVKECLVCGEKNIVAVHHYDENHNNNDPKNLVPLCPTHHIYMHSNKYKILILDRVIEYINTRWKE